MTVMMMMMMTTDDDDDVGDDVSDVAHPQTIVNVDSQRHFVAGS